MQEKQDYYVYIHRRKDTGEVFYVGHGRLRRAYNKGRTKTKMWEVINSAAGGHIVDILHNDLTKEQAEQIELDCIVNPPKEWDLVNIRLPVKRLELLYNELNDLFEYSENSQSGLVWKNSKFSCKNGKMAGSMQKTDNKKYWVVRKDDRLFLAHRIVYVLTTGKDIPSDFVIDHIDGNSLNNIAFNLRCVNQSENSMNSKKSESNTGEKYIRFDEGSIILRIKNDLYGRITRKFSVNKHGYDQAMSMAIKARDEFLKNTTIINTKR